MGIFDKLYRGWQQRAVMSQLPEVESAVAESVGNFKARTNLSYAHIFPILHDISVRLYVQDFGVNATRDHFENLFRSMSEDGLREDQFKNFTGAPEIQPTELPHTVELNAMLWRIANTLAANGIRSETVASAYFNIAVKASVKAIDPMVAAGYVLVSVRRLRDGYYG